MQVFNIPIKLNRELLQKILIWADKEEYFAYFNPNDHKTLYQPFDHFIAIGSKEVLAAKENAFEKLGNTLKNSGEYWVGYLSYELKDEMIRQHHQRPLTVAHEPLHFFRPETLIFFRENEISIQSEKDPQKILREIRDIVIGQASASNSIALANRTSKAEYIKNCEKIKQDIIDGEYYEINYCMEYFAENCDLNPIEKYFLLNELSPMPFSSFGKFKNIYTICASPERFLKREGDKLISQPIKGTIRRGKDIDEDLQLKTILRNSQKEIAENMMIVDLVRNDLSRSSRPGSVKVDEFFGIYTFRQVHQMISTVSATVNAGIDNAEIIKNAFPMGSMTGAPKIRVMKAIDEIEKSRRGIYSGATGYFKPNGDFDFNVVIRSIIYDSGNKKLSVHVGSAITFDADPGYEYEECLLKANSVMKILSV